MYTAGLIFLGIAVVSALPAYDPNRIVGGSTTTIEQYPFGAIIYSAANGVSFQQSCGGTIINNRSILTASHCFRRTPNPFQIITRVGSTFVSQGGLSYRTLQIIRHPNYNDNTLDMDFALIRVSGTFVFGNTVQAANIAGPNYNVADGQQVWAIGWGATCWGWCQNSETLRHVQVYSVNRNICRDRYAGIGRVVTNNMLCSGVLDVGGRDQCQGDSGGPLIHNRVIVGVCSWGQDCASARYPGVNAQVSVASNWIIANA